MTTFREGKTVSLLDVKYQEGFREARSEALNILNKLRGHASNEVATAVLFEALQRVSEIEPERIDKSLGFPRKKD